MNLSKKLQLSFLVFLLSIGHSIAQEAPLSLREALNYAMQNSEALQKAKLDILNGQHQIDEVRSNALPQLSATTNAAYNLIIPQFVFPNENGEFQTIQIGQAWQGMAQVQLSQQLFNQAVFTGLKAARSTEEYYRLAAELSEENLIQQVAANYFQVILNKEQIAVIDANIDRTKKLLEMTNSQYEVGLAKKIDLDRVKVNLSNLLAQREQLESAINQQTNLLKYYMGMPVDQSITLPNDIVSQLESEATITNDDFNVNKLLSFKVLQSQGVLLDYQKKSIVAEYYPTLSIGANYAYNTQSDRFNLYTNNALNYDMSAITLTLNIPIFDGFNRRSRVRQADIEIKKLEQDIKNTSNSLKMAHDNAKQQIKNSLTTIETQRENKQLAEEVYNSTQNNYKNGLASLTDLLTSETDLVTAQNSYNEALLKYKLAKIELLKANGNIKSLINQ
ncbi:TolC family protein [Olivibacter sitiensis]|uniref:TolC family protein n=1 Tax=Olivibacter sitiensis TaxID=376470 RepID=UPI0004179787|nr:TolC family protein [Olivibacter sitiensis]